MRFTRRCELFGVAITLCLLSGLAAAAPVSAIPPKPKPVTITYKGVTLAPAIVNVDLQKDQMAANFTITVVNNTKKPISLRLSSLDFKSLNTSGGVAFLGNNAAAVAHKYGLASWLTLPSAPLELKPNQTKPIRIVIENRADLSPGGHYAAVLFKAGENGPDGKTHIDINQVVSSLVFVRKIDGEKFDISLAKPTMPTSWFHLPTNIDLFFKNTGNVQTVPRGLVTIISPRGREVARGIINTDSSLVLPESTRLNRTALFRTARSWLPGHYQLFVQYRYDGSASVMSYRGTFWYVNVIPVVCGLLLLVIIWWVILRIKRMLRPPKQRSKSHNLQIRIK